MLASPKASPEAVGGGSLFALAPGHRELNGALHTYVALKKPDGWPPELTALITDVDTDPVPRPIYALPVEYRWDRVPGVTLLGDAAHLMAPSGEGANLAMYDGAELGKAIAASPGNIEAAALLAYERDIVPRSVSEAPEVKRILKVCFGGNAPQSLFDFFSNKEFAHRE
jgi:FAD binding domain-containing protein